MATDKKWLRDASMKRLSSLVKNKTEIMGSSQKLKLSLTSVDSLETSDLSEFESLQLKKWVQGRISGRQCLLSLLDHKHNQAPRSSVSPTDNFDILSILRSLVNLPADFLCNGGALYEQIFCRPPTVVIAEAVQMLVQKALESQSVSLGVQQVNTALKQMKIDALLSAQTEDKEGVQGEKDEQKGGKRESFASSLQEQGERMYVANIRVELIRIHIASRAPLSSALSYLVPHSSSQPPAPLSLSLQDQDLSLSFSDPSLFEKARVSSLLSKHLFQPLSQPTLSPAVYSSLSSQELEEGNALLKPFLSSLQASKHLLALYLSSLQSHRSFFVLGVSLESSTEEVKKRYRLLAVKMHPDKRGGSKGAFQMLQGAYQEVLRKVQEREEGEKMTREMEERDGGGGREGRGGKGERGGAKNRGMGVKREKGGSEERREKDKGEKVEEREEGEGDENSDLNLPPPPPPAQKKGAGEKEKTLPLSPTDPASPPLPPSSSPSSTSPPLPSFSSPHPEGGLEWGGDLLSFLSSLQAQVNFKVRALTHTLQRCNKVEKEVQKKGRRSLPGLHSSLSSFLRGEGGEELRGAVEHLEGVCELSQLFCSLSLLLPSKGGAHLSRALHLLGSAPLSPSSPSSSLPFVSLVEQAMGLSLLALKAVVPLVTSSEQVFSFQQRVDTLLGEREGEGGAAPLPSRPSSLSPELSSLLLDMGVRGVASLSLSLSQAVDQAVKLTFSLSSLLSLLGGVVERGREEQRQELRERLEAARQRGEEEDYSEEDREALRKARSGNNNQEESEGEREKKKQEEKEKEKEREEKSPLESLKEKILSLQLSLYTQQLTALHSLHGEVGSLQRKVIIELEALALPYFEPPAHSNNKGAARESLVKYLDTQIKPSSLSESLFSLLAEILDFDLHTLRTSLVHYTSTNVVVYESELRAFLSDQLAYLEIWLFEGQDLSLLVQRMKDTLLSSFSVSDPFAWGGGELGERKEEKEREAKEEQEKEGREGLKPCPRSAVLGGDYRSKLLYLCSALDPSSLSLLLEEEVLGKVTEITNELRNSLMQSDSCLLVPAHVNNSVKGGYEGGIEEEE